MDDFSFIETIGGIHAYRLNTNDLQVLVMPNHSAPVVAFMITYHVGSRHEGRGQTGATHFLEHMMFKGTERFHRTKGTSVFRTLQRVGGRINATTWVDRTNYYALLPRDELPVAMDIEADRMRNLLLNPEDVASERTVILNEWDRGENEPIRKLMHNIWSMAFLAHPYHHPTIGWRSDVETVTPEGLRHFYDTFYWPNNATLTIIGDVKMETALGLVKQYFGKISPAPHDLPMAGTPEPVQTGERRFVLRRAGQVGALMQGFKSPPATHPDADALDVLALILSGGKSSRFYRVLTDAGLTTMARATLPRLRDPGLFLCYALLNPDIAHETVEAKMRGVIEEIRNEGVTEKEVQRAKRQIQAQFAFGQDGPFAVAAQLNAAIAAGDWKLYATFLDRMEHITSTDIQRVAQTYLHPDQCTTGYYIPTVEAAA